ncbi:fibrillin-1-like [Sitodiplosis mosellana]|uniref:fibrillin-1-like n=1 Tax=Sitodiplosis mosellana TaxID=263140 RepID=UPI002444E8ED|nr:fibrillin-1-like [Sitodiplosis mosellana]
MCTYMKVILLLLSLTSFACGREIPTDGICYEFEKMDSITLPRQRCCHGFQFVNGKCVKIDSNPICQCPPGHQSDLDSLYCNCEPICDTICENGRCIASNQCECNEGYAVDKDYGGECRPICMPSCVKGGCAAPNKCICFDGYKLKLGSQLVCIPEHLPDACDDGYIYADGICKPVCAPNCVNGKCTAPNQCACNEGYKFSRESKQRCISVGPIECESGQQLVNGECTSVCYPPCKNGKCFKNNQCICNEGYRSMYGMDRCVLDNDPICEPDCVRGKCIGRNICQCDNGYTLHPYLNICVPSCTLTDYCENGTCVPPGVCTCNEGFQFSDMNPNTCEPTQTNYPQSNWSKVYVKSLLHNRTVRVSFQTWKH